MSALIPHGDALVLELLRFSQELRDLDEHELPGRDLKKYKVSKQEIELATKFVEGMTSEWEPSEFEDEYRTALMKLVQKKIERGETEPIEVEEPKPEEEPRTINFMDVLKQSVAHASKRGRTTKRAATKKAPSRRRTTKKKRAG